VKASAAFVVCALAADPLPADIVEGDSRFVGMGAVMGQPRSQLIALRFAERRGGLVELFRLVFLHIFNSIRGMLEQKIKEAE
jgi:hypothetical protein